MTTRRSARIAGMLYLWMGLPAPFALLYVPGIVVVARNAAAARANILAHETLFRLGILAEVITGIGFLLLALALYRLLSGVNRTHASVMVTLVIVSVALTFANLLNNLAALALVRGAPYLSVFDGAERDALALLFLGLHRQGLAANEIFWGLWLLPFGILVMKSGFLPRILGLLLVVNGFGYVAASLAALLAPAYAGAVSRAVFPTLLGELWIMVWLLVRGAKGEAAAAA